jgi:hypothetical protein
MRKYAHQKPSMPSICSTIRTAPHTTSSTNSDIVITHKLLHTPTMHIRRHALTRAQEEYHAFMTTTSPLHIRIGTRGSTLARWQSDFVAQSLVRMHPHITTTTNVITTKGDIDVRSPLPLIGGKGLFTAEIEQQLHAQTINIAVHSLKDLPTEATPGLPIVAIPVRGDHADVLISRYDYTLQTLPLGARIGASTYPPRRPTTALTTRFTDCRYPRQYQFTITKSHGSIARARCDCARTSRASALKFI